MSNQTQTQTQTRVPVPVRAVGGWVGCWAPHLQAARAVALRVLYLQVGDGVGQQERLSSTQALCDEVGASPEADQAPDAALAQLRAEAVVFFSALSFGTFPRFIKSAAFERSQRPPSRSARRRRRAR